MKSIESDIKKLFKELPLGLQMYFIGQDLSSFHQNQINQESLENKRKIYEAIKPVLLDMSSDYQNPALTYEKANRYLVDILSI